MAAVAGWKWGALCSVQGARAVVMVGSVRGSAANIGAGWFGTFMLQPVIDKMSLFHEGVSTQSNGRMNQAFAMQMPSTLIIVSVGVGSSVSMMVMKTDDVRHVTFSFHTWRSVDDLRR